MDYSNVFRNKITIDGAILFSVIYKIFQALSGIVTLLLITEYLTTKEQGYFYTFGSVAAIQVFFELGLTNILIQFVAHENAKLNWGRELQYENLESLSRLSSLFRFSVRWFTFASIFLFFGLLIFGFFFFKFFGDKSIAWELPWLTISLSTSLSLLITPIHAFFEGVGMVKNIAILRLLQQITQLILVGIFLLNDWKLMSFPVAIVLSLFITPIWIYLNKWQNNIKNLWHSQSKYIVDYKSEIFPLQWKIAISWLSGYFIFQLFNPVIFASEGPVKAGQMGMTITVLNAIFAISYSWINAKSPYFTNLIARKEFQKLDYIFRRSLIKSLTVNIIGFIVFILVIFFIPESYYSNYFRYLFLILHDKFIPFWPMIFMMFASIFNHIISALAMYLRNFKKEPMLVQSIVVAIVCAISILYFEQHNGMSTMIFSFFTITFISMLWTIYLFKKYSIIYKTQ